MLKRKGPYVAFAFLMKSGGKRVPLSSGLYDISGHIFEHYRPPHTQETVMRVLSGFAFSICPHYFCCSITLPIGLASRFRMRQVNVVGTSPFSPSSRVIQTLQAPPDVAPTSITVRTASETSLRLRWVVSVGGGKRGKRGLPGWEP